MTLDELAERAIVAFLDFDGVIASPRAWMAQEEIADRDTRWIDPLSCKLLTKLQRKYGFSIVVSSTWRAFGRDRCAAVLAPYGLDVHLHDDWATNHAPDGSRPAEIDDWLRRNGEPDFIIFDDDPFAWTGPQMARWVKSCSYNGFQCESFEQADKILRALSHKEQSE